MSQSQPELYIRDGDTFGTVYEVDRVAKVIRMYGSKVGNFGFQYPLRDYLPEGFVPVDVVEKDESRVVVRRT